MESPQPSPTELDLMKLEVMKARVEVALALVDQNEPYFSFDYVAKYIGLSSEEIRTIQERNKQ